MEPPVSRALWHLLEHVNAVTYFSPECREGCEELGLKGFWMGYFANRAAPLGPVGAGPVEACFFNFHPARVGRAIPDAWAYATPTEVLDARSTAAAAALRRLLPDGRAEAVSIAALPLLTRAIDEAQAAGRPLFAGNRDVAAPADPVGALWQAATTLREHRGDGHVALLTGAGLDGCEVHVLFAASEGVSPELFLQSRGWSSEDWTAATERLVERGLVAKDATATSPGRTLREQVEERTDQLASMPYGALGAEEVEDLIAILRPAAETIAASGDIRFPNPMGLPPVEGHDSSEEA